MTRESRIAIARERKVVAILAELMHQARRSGVERAPGIGPENARLHHGVSMRTTRKEGML